MRDKVVEQQALKRIKAIHQLSQRVNAMLGKPHQGRLLELMRKHIDEIEQLAAQQDPHYVIETGDLLILCFELLLEGGADIEEVSLTCFERYEKKLMELIEQVKGEE